MNQTSSKQVSVLYPKPKTPVRSIVIALLGTIVEYYDYALYGFFAAIMAQHFFTVQDGDSALLKTFAIFATGSIAKPVGALFFGYIGDYYGRRLALKVSMLGIAVPTTIIGLIPDSTVWGHWAAVTLLLCRFTQGFFVAGESDGVRIFIHETLPKNRSYFANSIVTLSALIGAYIASHIGTYVARDPSQWQVPFLVGGAMGIVILVLRQFIPETPEYEEKKKEVAKSPWWVVFMKENRAAVVASMAIAGAIGGTYHFYCVFWKDYISQVLSFVDTVTAATFASRSILFFALGTPFAGVLGDYLGGRQVFRLGLALLGVLFSLNIVLTLNGMVIPWVIYATSFCIPFMYTPAYPIMMEQFKVVERYRCLSFGHAFGSVLFSGSAPAICMGLNTLSGNKYMALSYFGLILFLAFLGLRLATPQPASQRSDEEALTSQKTGEKNVA